MGAVKVYRDEASNAIFFEDANGAQFINSLQAIENIDNAENVDIRYLYYDKNLVSNINFMEFVDQNGDSYGNNASEVTNALNVVFTNSGTSTDQLPSITSPTSINAVSGAIINYELTADFGVGYEWESLPSGITNVEGNVRKLIGALPSGTYNVTMRAINYNGVDSKVLTINVSNPPFANTKSVNFVGGQYATCSASDLNPIFGRATNGSGASDAWSISTYFKSGIIHTSDQTIFNFGSTFMDAGLQLRYNHFDERIELFYGDTFNYILIRSSNNSIPTRTWIHVFVTYDGGTTGDVAGDINDYYSRFKIFLNGVEVTYNNTNRRDGFSGEIPDEIAQIGRYEFGGYMHNDRVDELAFWDSDQQANVALIYNSGVPFDLSVLPVPPNHWYRMGDGDTYPTLQDSIGSSNLTMVNMTSANIVNDVP